jgi:LPXTG-motif cell wall-anchored protein
MTQDPLYILLGILLAALILGWFYFRKPRAPETQRADLRSQGEFRPARLRVHTGIPLHLHVHRLEGEPEEEWFLVPELGIREPLPPYMTTVVHFEPLSAGEFKMACRKGVARGTLIAEESD